MDISSIRIYNKHILAAKAYKLFRLVWVYVHGRVSTKSYDQYRGFKLEGGF